MKTIGKVLKEARLKKRKSILAVEEETKIKKEFIGAIEDENWSTLPELPVILGFVKNIAKVLSIDERQLVAVLKRDYPPKILAVNPKPDVSKSFVWNPRITFLVGVGTILIIILGYLGFQYVKFVSPPPLTVYEPKNEQVIKRSKVKISGKTDPDATVVANNQPILVDDKGNFSGEVEVFEGTGEIEVKALFRTGKDTQITRKIKVELR